MNAMMKQQKSQDDSMDTDSNSDDNVEILTHTDRPKPLPLLKEKNSNSKTSQATLTKPLTNISNMRLYKLAQQLQQRLMIRIAQ